MNWRDSIWVFRLGPQWAFPKRSAQCLVPYSENKGYASNPRRFYYQSLTLRSYLRGAEVYLNHISKTQRKMDVMGLDAKLSQKCSEHLKIEKENNERYRENGPRRRTIKHRVSANEF